MYLLQVTGFFTLMVLGIFVFIAYYLQKRKRIAKTKRHLRNIYSDLISEISLCESEEELEGVVRSALSQTIQSTWLTKSLGRKILIKELVKSKDSLTGDAANNLRWLYEKLELDKESFRRFSSRNWHTKASGIQQLAEMQQAKYLVKIYRETNSRNPLVRTEAQIAVVKLTGFKGLRFLNIVNHPVTQWQQLCLIDQLKEQDIELGKINAWLSSGNETVVEFALRLVEIYKCYDLQEEVIRCAAHTSQLIRMQAFRSLKEIATEAALPFLMTHFRHCYKQEQLFLIDMIAELAEAEGIRFLQSLTSHPDESIRYKVKSRLLLMGSTITEQDTTATYLLSPLQKHAI
jgi:hypothetical protein